MMPLVLLQCLLVWLWETRPYLINIKENKSIISVTTDVSKYTFFCRNEKTGKTGVFMELSHNILEIQKYLCIYGLMELSHNILEIQKCFVFMDFSKYSRISGKKEKRCGNIFKARFLNPRYSRVSRVNFQIELNFETSFVPLFVCSFCKEKSNQSILPPKFYQLRYNKVNPPYIDDFYPRY